MGTAIWLHVSNSRDGDAVTEISAHFSCICACTVFQLWSWPQMLLPPHIAERTFSEALGFQLEALVQVTFRVTPVLDVPVGSD